MFRNLAGKFFNEVTGASRPQSWRSSSRFIILVVAWAVFTDQFVFAVILPVYPFSLHDRQGIPEDRVQFWVALLLGVYAIATVISSPLWGWYADRKSSRKVPWLIGLIFIIGTTVMLWLAPNKSVSVVARCLQGLACAVVWSTGLAVLVDAVGEARVGEAMGYVGIALNFATLLAPILGGVVFSKVGYNAVFYVTFGILGIDVVLRVLMVERHLESSSAAGSAELDPELAVGSRSLTPTSNMIPETMSKVREGSGKIQDDEKSTTRPDVLSTESVDLNTRSLSVATTLEKTATCSDDSTLESATFTSKKRHLPAFITLLFSLRFLAATWGVIALAAIYSGVETVLPLYTSRVFGWDSIGGGLIFLPFMIPSLLGPYVGSISDRYGGRWLTVAGFAIACPALVLLRLVYHDTIGHKVLLCVFLTIIGICITMTLDPLMAEFTYIATKHDLGVAHKSGEKGKTSYAQVYGLFNMAWAAGGTVGPFWAGAVVDAYGWSTMAWNFGLLAGISAIPALLWCGGWIRDENFEEDSTE